MPSTLLLASSSKSRIRMMREAHIEFDHVAPRVDEMSVKQALLADGHKARDIADALAEIKAQKVASSNPDRLVLGCDQTLDLDGALFDKPQSKTQAKEQLLELRGKSHKLHSAIVIFESGKPIYRHIGTAKLYMRPFSDTFLSWYLDNIGEDVLNSVGCYHLEGIGSQLFSSIEGDYFTILGMPLLNVIAYLRNRSVLIE